MATHSRTLAWKIPWMEEPGRLQCMGLQRVRHNWATSLSLISVQGSSLAGDLNSLIILRGIDFSVCSCFFLVVRMELMLSSSLHAEPEIRIILWIYFGHCMLRRWKHELLILSLSFLNSTFKAVNFLQGMLCLHTTDFSISFISRYFKVFSVISFLTLEYLEVLFNFQVFAFF